MYAAAAALACSSQQVPTSKEVHRAPAPYAKEETVGPNAGLAEKEVELRGELRKQPESPDLLYRLAVVLRQEGKARASLDAYTQAARYRIPNPGELRSVALDYVVLNDYEDAIRWLESALKMGPNNVAVVYSLGRCYYSKDRYLDAGKLFERVLAI